MNQPCGQTTSRAGGAGRCAGFTLVEVTMVAVVVAVLLAVAFPVIQMAIANAKKQQAATEVQMLMAAVKSYRSVYGKWPYQTSADVDRTFFEEEEQSNLIHVLVRNNPRGIQFLETKEESMLDGCLVDPWGNRYIVAVDQDGDGMTQIDVSDFRLNDRHKMSLRKSTVVTVSNIAKETVAVISWGPSPSNTETRVYSWALGKRHLEDEDRDK